MGLSKEEIYALGEKALKEALEGLKDAHYSELGLLLMSEKEWLEQAETEFSFEFTDDYGGKLAVDFRHVNMGIFSIEKEMAGTKEEISEEEAVLEVKKLLKEGHKFDITYAYETNEREVVGNNLIYTIGDTDVLAIHVGVEFLIYGPTFEKTEEGEY